MDVPITDIVFVCDPDKAPDGYTAITRCPCGHDAQLWEKVLGGEEGVRYLCFTKKNQDDNMVVEDMYIPGPSQQYLKKNYKILKNTVEGQEPMRHKQLAVKRVPKTEATRVVVDLIVSRSKDSISKLYTKLSKVNGLRIAFRTADYKQTAIKPSLNEYNPSPTASRSVEKPAPTSPTDLGSYSPSPPFKSKVLGDDVVRVKYEVPVASAPPPSSSPPTQEPTPTHQPEPTPSTSTGFPVKFDDDSSSAYPSGGNSDPPKLPPPSHGGSSPYQSATPTLYPQDASGTQYHRASYPSINPHGASPHQRGSYPGVNPHGASSAPYPAPPTNAGAGGYYSQQQTTYSNPSLPYNPTPPSYHQANQPGGGFYPPPNPSAPSTGYDTSIGFSFGGSAPPQGHAPSYPAAPYGTQPQQNYPPQPPQGGGAGYPTPTAPPPSQSNQPSYGFNF